MCTRSYQFDGRCPRCDQSLPSYREYYGADADGNRGIWVTMTEPECGECGWTLGEEVKVCDFCGDEEDELYETPDGDEYCKICFDADLKERTA